MGCCALRRPVRQASGARGLEAVPRGPLPVFSEVHFLKGFKSFVLEVRILHGLHARFAEVRIPKDLEANVAVAQITQFRVTLAARLTAWLNVLWREAKEPRGSALSYIFNSAQLAMSGLQKA